MTTFYVLHKDSKVGKYNSLEGATRGALAEIRLGSREEDIKVWADLGGGPYETYDVRQRQEMRTAQTDADFLKRLGIDSTGF